MTPSPGTENGLHPVDHLSPVEIEELAQATRFSGSSSYRDGNPTGIAGPAIMRREGPTHTKEGQVAEHARSRDTTASPDTLWQIWSDPTTWGEWNPDVAQVKLDGPFAVGTSGEMFMTSGRHHKITIESIESGKQFALLATAIPGHPFLFRCEVAATGSGSRVTQGVTVRGPLAGLLSPMMGEKVAEGFVPILNALAKQAESKG
ncbi:MAG: hypothetical protein EXR58_06215 [Chloroflexi bacterium]|nr:hypothetical protein [Chloroflexota bacterium]